MLVQKDLFKLYLEIKSIQHGFAIATVRYISILLQLEVKFSSVSVVV